MAKPVFNKDSDLTHWVSRLPDSFDHSVVATRKDNGDLEESVYQNATGMFAPFAWPREGDWMW